MHARPVIGPPNLAFARDGKFVWRTPDNAVEVVSENRYSATLLFTW